MYLCHPLLKKGQLHFTAQPLSFPSVDTVSPRIPTFDQLVTDIYKNKNPANRHGRILSFLNVMNVFVSKFNILFAFYLCIYLSLVLCHGLVFYSVFCFKVLRVCVDSINTFFYFDRVRIIIGFSSFLTSGWGNTHYVIAVIRTLIKLKLKYFNYIFLSVGLCSSLLMSSLSKTCSS